MLKVIPFVPKVSPFLPKVSPFVPKVDPYVPKMSPYVPKVSHVCPKRAHFVPKVNTTKILSKRLNACKLESGNQHLQHPCVVLHVKKIAEQWANNE